MEKAFLHILQPDVYRSHCNVLLRHDETTWPSLFFFIAYYATETSEQHPTAFASIVRALRTLRVEQEDLYEEFEQKLSGSFKMLVILQPETENICTLVRQDGEL